MPSRRKRGTVIHRCEKCKVRIVNDRLTRCPTCSRPLTWSVSLSIPDPSRADGRRRVWLTASPNTQEAANRLLTRKLAEYDKQGSVTNTKQGTYGAFLENWLPSLRGGIRATTLKTWRSIVRSKLASDCTADKQMVHPGHLALEELTTRYLQEFFAHLHHDHGLATSTVGRVRMVTVRSLGDAVRWGLLAVNPGRDAPSPRRSAEGMRQRRERKAWDGESLRFFLKHEADSREFPMWYLASVTGMRRSELCGLRWQDVSFTRQALHVRNRLAVIDRQDSEDGSGIDEDEPKSTKARLLYLTDRDVVVLRTWQYRQREEGTAGDGTYVFTTVKGEPWDPDNVSRMFERLVKHHALPDLSVHGLRHTYATLSLKAGVDLSVVSERLGHASVEFTRDMYVHVDAELQAEAADRFQDMIGL